MADIKLTSKGATGVILMAALTEWKDAGASSFAILEALEGFIKAVNGQKPPTEGLWAIHIPGPDDVWACASKEAAERHAQLHNASIRKLGLAERFGMEPATIEARVIEWPHSAESHAQSLRDDVADTL